MSKQMILLLTLAVMVAVAILTLLLNNAFNGQPSKSEIDTAINQAQLIYRERKKEGWDFSSGPCLTNALMPGWVLDIAHNPRIPADDLPQNICPAYLEGRAKHFVELDPDGNLIRAR